jgi:serine/threonine protein kinase
MNDPDHSLPIGYSLNEYRIDAVLGVGGFGLTYLATDANLNLKVAVKEYLPGDLAGRDEDGDVQPRSDDVDTTETFRWGLQRFMEEAKTLASFRHPNIVRVMRFFQANQTGYMVMEFVEGKPLPEWIVTRRPLPETALLALVLPLLDGLEIIHKAGYLHRDIKPANILMRDDDSPVLIDFGSARPVTRGNQELTAIVSPGYAPLEQYHTHGRQGPWSDIYALGGVMYWMTTGNKPPDAAARVRHDAMPAARQAGDQNIYSAAFLAAIDWALQPHEEERPQSVAQLRGALMRGGGTLPASGKAGRNDEDSTRTQLMAPEPASRPQDVQLDHDLMERMQADLVQHIGPIAPIVVKNAARKATTVQTLCELVAIEISDKKERKAFLRKFSSGVSPGNYAMPPDAAIPGNFSADALQKTEIQLSKYIGAVAKVIVSRAARKARDETELYLMIADEIQDADERRAFIRMAVSAHGKPR